MANLPNECTFISLKNLKLHIDFVTRTIQWDVYSGIVMWNYDLAVLGKFAHMRYDISHLNCKCIQSDLTSSSKSPGHQHWFILY